MRSTMAALPLVVPGMLLWAVMAIGASPRVARTLRISRWHAVFLLLALGLVLMATLPPTGALLAGRGSPVDHCDLSRMGVAPWSVLLRPNETSLNVLLFVPLGLALGALPGSPRAAVLIVGAFLLPVAIELFQLAAARTRARLPERRRHRQHDGPRHRPGPRVRGPPAAGQTRADLTTPSAITYSSGTLTLRVLTKPRSGLRAPSTPGRWPPPRACTT